MICRWDRILLVNKLGSKRLSRQLSIGGGSRPYPQRFNEPDCIFYLRDGFCVYGPRCPFNHPPNPILAMEARRAAAREYPQREGQSVYQYYMRTGMRSFGASCKYHHPRHRGESPGMVMPNIHGYPLRSGKGQLNIDTLMNHGSHLVIFTEASEKTIPLQGLSAMFCTNNYCRSLKVGIANIKNLVTCSYDLCTDSKCRKR